MKARGVCSQDEGLHFGRGTKNLRYCLRKVFGRRRKSRRPEAAGRRNSPEAVPNERVEWRPCSNYGELFFGKQKAQSTRDTRHPLVAPAGGLSASKAQCIASSGWPCGRRQREGASPMSRIVGSRRGEAKGETMRTAGTRRFDFAFEAGHFLGADSARDGREPPERPTPESNLQPGGFLDAGDFAKCGRVRRTGPSFTGRPRSVFRLH